tara:strand:+ start:239 stop:847 length:609 start_codon:yes stop_codon:yes gene_type:complete
MRVLLSLIIIFFSFTNLQSKEKNICNVLTEKYGKKYNLPNKLLTSIALVESGFKKNKNFYSWPWTLNVSGKSFYFDTKKEILNYLKNNIREKKSMDVGCMQINTKYHLKNFKDLNQIIEPEENVKYAAKFLSDLYKKHRSWNEAIARYHSSIPKRKKRYLKKVYNFWNDIRQRKILNDYNYVNSFEKRQIENFKKILKKENI